MTDQRTILVRSAISSDKSSATRYYVMLASKDKLRATTPIHGYAEQNEDKTWSYWKFKELAKGETAPHEPELKSTCESMSAAISSGTR